MAKVDKEKSAVFLELVLAKNNHSKRIRNEIQKALELYKKK